MSRGLLLLSIHPQHASSIFDGSKKVELRRVRPRVVKGDWVLVYVTSPLKVLAGGCRVERVIEAPLATLWREVEGWACVSRQMFDEYYAGTTIGFGIVFDEVRMLNRPVALEHLRECWPGFRPPQCYRYLPFRDVDSLGIMSQLEASQPKQQPASIFSA